jgi:hypothetical protein
MFLLLLLLLLLLFVIVIVVSAVVVLFTLTIVVRVSVSDHLNSGGAQDDDLVYSLAAQVLGAGRMKEATDLYAYLMKVQNGTLASSRKSLDAPVVPIVFHKHVHRPHSEPIGVSV